MKACLLFTAAFAATAFSAAVPVGRLQSEARDIFKRAVTTDGTCGGVDKITCRTDAYKCCSQFGWCGDSIEHCGTGCQPEFGVCFIATTPTTTPAATITLPRTKPGKIPYGSWISTCVRPGFVALTFDDGPHIFTPGLLDILKKNGVVATFFLNGQNWGDPITSASKVALVKRMLKEGHQIASHGWSHPDMSTLSESQLISEMTQLESAFLKIIGKFPTYMRPPYFSCGTPCLQTMGKLGYHVMHTDLDTQDWRYASSSEIYQSRNIFAAAINSANPATKGFIPLAHDVHESTVYGLVQSMIDTLKKKGFRATTVGWCLDDHSSNWYRTKQ
ncbi:glycoside hydrolase/deacetylase [Wilcoxina mikolae CBS 423.85]|nr:glycoside hydrolase/deacetylase [Wilcoxina mikolae CBS 423.85]